MADNGTSAEEEFFRDVGSSFMDWTWEVLLPILIVILLVIFFLLGMLINSMLLVVSVRNGWHKEPVHAFVIQLCIVDLTASVFVVLPSLISIRRDGPAFPDSQEGCNFQHVIFTLCLLLSYFFITTGVIERTIRTVNTKLYIKYFGNSCCLILMILVVWMFSFIISFITLIDQKIKYDEDLYYCTIQFKKGSSVLSILFTMWYYLPSCVVIGCFATIFYHRSRDVRRANDMTIKDDQDLIEPIQKPQIVTSNDRSTSVFYIERHKKQEKPRTVADKNTLFFLTDKYGCKKHPLSLSVCTSNAKVGSQDADDQIDGANVTIVRHSPSGQTHFLTAKKKWKNFTQRVKGRGKIAQVFRDKSDDANHHQAITYLLTWVVMMLGWLIFVIAQYINVYSNRCDPCLMVGMFMGLATYSCKPLIYISHNRWYKSICIGTIKKMCSRKT